MDQVQSLSSKLALVFSDGEALSVEGNEDSEYEFHSYAHVPGNSSYEGFRPSMELTDAFFVSEAILKRLQAEAEGAMRTLDFASRQHCVGDITNGVSSYEWRWVLSKDTTHGAEIFRRTLTVSFKQNGLSSAEAPVTIGWVSEIFQQAQLSWYSWSGQVSKRFSDVEREGFEESLNEASAQAEAALRDKLGRT